MFFTANPSAIFPLIEVGGGEFVPRPLVAGIYPVLYLPGFSCFGFLLALEVGYGGCYTRAGYHAYV